MISSMTGFGTAEGPVGNSRVTVELRTVNHRFFSPSIKLPPSLARWEGEIREALRRQIARGHISVTVRLSTDGSAAQLVDENRFAAYVKELKELARRHALNAELDLATVLRLPGVVNDGTSEPEPESPKELLQIVEAALKKLSEMRGAEGMRLAGVVHERLDVIEAALQRIAERAPERVVQHRDRLMRNVAELAGGVSLDPQRISQEVAILADRLDIAEELDRFRAHLDAFRTTLAETGGDPIGKRLGFLLQELLREANTTGSKANDAGMLADVVAIKEELERIREQVENLE
jgi:uncharacterized protein (TIGR00255 family)